MYSLYTWSMDNNVATKVMVITVILLSLLNDVLPSSLTREELAACVYWDEFDIDLCYPGSHKCNGGSDCCPCPEGTFMTWQNKCPQCLPFRDCYGQEVLFPGNSEYDRVCGNFPVSTESVPPKPTKATGNPPSSSEDDEEGDESIEENNSTPPSNPYEPPDDEADPSDDLGDPSDDLDKGTPTIKFDSHTLELVTIFILTVVTVAFVVDKLCGCFKPCRCWCDVCKGCTASDCKRSSHERLPLHERNGATDTNEFSVVSSETSEKESRSTHQKKKSTSRGRKRSRHILT